MKKKTRLILGALIIGAALLLAALAAADILKFQKLERQKEIEGDKYCSSYLDYECPDVCMVCPPCAECSSLGCRSEEFCEGIGFTRAWYDGIKERLNESD